MNFSSCNNYDAAIGYLAMFVAFVLAVFQLNSYVAMSEENKQNHMFQFVVSIIIVFIISAYFLYRIAAPALSVGKQFGQKINARFPSRFTGGRFSG